MVNLIKEQKVGHPPGPVGLLKHVFVDGLVGAVFHHNDPGLDPQ